MKNKLKRLLTWPHSERRPDLFPWWRIAWNFVWIPVIVLGAMVYSLGVLMQQGVDTAEATFNDLI